MKLFLSLLFVFLLATVRQTSAQGYGMGDSRMGGATRPASTPQPNYGSSQNSANAAATSNAKAGPMSASVSLSDGSRSGASFSAKTRQLSASFTTSGTNKGDKLQAVWVSKVNGQKKINATSLTGEQANFVGSVSINGPAAGWPAGKYELDLLVNNKLIARQPFTMTEN